MKGIYYTTYTTAYKAKVLTFSKSVIKLGHNEVNKTPLIFFDSISNQQAWWLMTKYITLRRRLKMVEEKARTVSYDLFKYKEVLYEDE